MGPKINNVPVVSVVIPVFNTEAALERCVSSILAQTFNDFEVWLVDDGSTDGSGSICDEYTMSDRRIHTIHIENGGPANARNKGLGLAKGKWITFIDADDYIESWAFEKMLAASTDTDLIVSGRIHEYGAQSEVRIYEAKNLHSDNPVKLLVDCEPLCDRDYITNRFFKAEIIKKNNLGFENVRTGEDTLFNFDFHLHISSAKSVAFAYYHYVKTGTSISQGYQSTKRDFHDCLYKRLNIMRTYAKGGDGIELFVDMITQSTLYVEVANLFFTHNDLSFLEKRKCIKSRFYDNGEFMRCLRRQRSFASLNNRVIAFLLLHKMFDVSMAYIRVASFIKNLKNKI